MALTVEVLDLVSQIARLADRHRHWCKTKAEVEQSLATAITEIAASERGTRELAERLAQALKEVE